MSVIFQSAAFTIILNLIIVNGMPRLTGPYRILYSSISTLECQAHAINNKNCAIILTAYRPHRLAALFILSSNNEEFVDCAEAPNASLSASPCSDLFLKTFIFIRGANHSLLLPLESSLTVDHIE